MTIKEYHEHPALSRSRLWLLHESPQKFKWAEEHPEPPSPAFRLGAAFHKLALEPETFDNEYVVAPTIDRRTKDGKVLWEKFTQDSAEMGKELLNVDEMEVIAAMRESLMANPTARVLIEKGQKEQSFFWKEPNTGIEMKCRPDVLLTDDLKVIADLKSCSSADTEAFTRDVLRYGYDVQAALYTEGVQQSHPGKYAFIFIAVEKTPPYAVNVLETDSLVIDYGYIRYRELLDTYAECLNTGNWYGFNGAENIMNKIELPAWVK